MHTQAQEPKQRRRSSIKFYLDNSIRRTHNLYCDDVARAHLVDFMRSFEK